MKSNDPLMALTKPRKGMGFKAAQASVQKREGVSKESAAKIIASGARNASSSAKRANPNLKKVK